ncbi:MULTISPECIES: hypothetical protein [Cyanophyceae]|uniref:Uncharacterized protein n=1 Tax=Aphanothece cf. minutissima CCALA 015 TaxID=2107695 RepID=A0ABX5F6Y4_9CHRO|nr:MULTISPECIES: hypothetical protein [Cyanophyceae]MCP9796313.1 hypothetical protein [Cyanobium sp. Lug-B]MCP9934589.1 hypothetical protein [Cyanobium sp. Candia 9D4]PSB36109.1 hypothetical protein C7B81_15165 [Aphanothece cf. minutissima CCALA 015]
MLTPTTRLRLQEIIGRIADSRPVSLHERIYVQKFADRDASVWSWLRRAQRTQQRGEPESELDRLTGSLDLGDPCDSEGFDPGRDDLGDWFSGAPNWLRRS